MGEFYAPIEKSLRTGRSIARFFVFCETVPCMEAGLLRIESYSLLPLHLYIWEYTSAFLILSLTSSLLCINSNSRLTDTFSSLKQC